MKLQSALLWFDNDPKIDFVDKVNDAMLAYQYKFGELPDICYVHPMDLPEQSTQPLGLTVEPEPSVLRHHIYIGSSRPAR